MRRRPDFPHTARPFSLTPDPGYFFQSSRHEAALRCLEKGLREGRYLQVLTGAPGQGKTTLLQASAIRLDRAFLPVFVSLDRVETERELLRSISLGLSLSFTGKSPSEMEDGIRDFARRHGQKGRGVLLLVDEADSCEEPLLKWFPRLSGTSSERRGRIPMILAGPPDLGRRAAAACSEYRVYPGTCSLTEMSPEESVRYILHRLCVAGLDPPAVFSPGALDLIVKGCGGVPRTINVICAAVMDICRGTRQWPAEPGAVREALLDLNLDVERGPRVEPDRIEVIERFLETSSRQGPERTPPGFLRGARKLKRFLGVRAGNQTRGGLLGGWRAASRAGRPGTGGTVRAGDTGVSMGDLGRFLAWFLLVVVLLGGGTLFQVVRHERQTREVKRRIDEHRLGVPGPQELPRVSPVGPGLSGRDGVDAVADPMAGYLQDRKRAIREGLADPYPHTLEPVVSTEVFQDRDISGIALDCCNGLDQDLMEAFMRLNPHVKDWNALRRTVELVLPDPRTRSVGGRRGGVDVHSVCLDMYDSRPGAFRAAEGLTRAGLQNVFVTPAPEGAEGGMRYRLCTGVFLTQEAASEVVPWMKRSGFPGARPSRIREASLARVLHPYRRPDGDAAREERPGLGLE